MGKGCVQSGDKDMSTITVTSSTYTVVTSAGSAVTITVNNSAGAIGVTGPAGPVGATGATGESGINRVYYGTGSAPSPIGEADGALFFKYT
jgi:hypothetical protein